MAVSVRVGNKLRFLLGAQNAAALISQLNADAASQTVGLRTKLNALLGNRNAAAVFDLLGTGNSVQPNLRRKLRGFLGEFDSQSMVTEIEGA